MLILLAHGSRDPRWRASVQKLAESVRAKLGCEPVRVAYLEGSPALPDLAADAARAGVKRLRILPFFLRLMDMFFATFTRWSTGSGRRSPPLKSSCCRPWASTRCSRNCSARLLSSPPKAAPRDRRSPSPHDHDPA
jgi:hypothetical protein